jgi:hypothetical protein
VCCWCHWTASTATAAASEEYVSSIRRVHEPQWSSSRFLKQQTVGSMQCLPYTGSVTAAVAAAAAAAARAAARAAAAAATNRVTPEPASYPQAIAVALGGWSKAVLSRHGSVGQGGAAVGAHVPAAAQDTQQQTVGCTLSHCWVVCQPFVRTLPASPASQPSSQPAAAVCQQQQKWPWQPLHLSVSSSRVRSSAATSEAARFNSVTPCACAQAVRLVVLAVPLPHLCCLFCLLSLPADLSCFTHPQAPPLPASLLA